MAIKLSTIDLGVSQLPDGTKLRRKLDIFEDGSREAQTNVVYPQDGMGVSVERVYLTRTDRNGSARTTMTEKRTPTRHTQAKPQQQRPLAPTASEQDVQQRLSQIAKRGMK